MDGCRHVCLNVCICVYLFIYTCIYIYICVCVCVCVCTFLCMKFFNLLIFSMSPVQTMAFRRSLLSFSRCVQFIIVWLIVCFSFSPQGHVEFGIILNLWRYDLVKP